MHRFSHRSSGSRAARHPRRLDEGGLLTIRPDLLFVDGEDYGSFSPRLIDVLLGSTYFAAYSR